MLPVNINLDTIKTMGIYCCQDNTLNAPTKDWGVLIVFLPYNNTYNTAQLWLGTTTKSRWTAGRNDAWGPWL